MVDFHLDGIRKKLYQETVAFERRTEISPEAAQCGGKAGGRMRVGFVGAGKVGFTLGRYFTERNVCVSGYYSRSLKSSKEAAAFTKTKYYEKIEELIKESDTLFLTVPDGSIREVCSELTKADIEGKIICHCSGAMSSMVFSGIRQKGAYGYSVHPICAVGDKLTGYRDFSKVYLTIEGDEAYLTQLQELFLSLGNQAEVISAEKKIRYHAAAVFASNLMVGLYDSAVELFTSCGLSSAFSEAALRSLFYGNAEKIAEHGAVAALSGPVERGDAETVEKHLEELEGDKRKIYLLLSKQLIGLAQRKNPKRDYTGIQMALEEAEQTE